MFGDKWKIKTDCILFSHVTFISINFGQPESMSKMTYYMGNQIILEIVTFVRQIDSSEKNEHETSEVVFIKKYTFVNMYYL